MSQLIVAAAGYTGIASRIALRDSCVACSLLAGLVLIGIGAYHLLRAPDPEQTCDF